MLSNIVNLVTDPKLIFGNVALLTVIWRLLQPKLEEQLDAYFIYRSKPFFIDKEPGSPDFAQLHSSATGNWYHVLIQKKKFWTLNLNQRGVHVLHEDGNKEIMTFRGWASRRKKEPNHQQLQEFNRFL
jgi:hypothetical protein